MVGVLGPKANTHYKMENLL